ncbi:putative membrane protein ycf1 [Heracleum sosnowskyi]|uniref:Membrane protein ycf1 n=1 Tax=Heracleum sosnowskyi TaxID=360622 RepID=A0AAD8ML88_9APIA|nr:putative membrane protein ycf1 [Heracleum sosnowskyi]
MNFRNMDEFWPYFLTQHSKRATRMLHFAGTSTSLLCLIYSLMFDLRYLLCVPVVAYGVAWYSHFFVERNVPASFDYPLWSFLCDMKMCGFILTAQMDKEIKRLGKKPVPGDN